MRINQLSVFLENREGTLVQLLDILGKAGIQLIAISVADTAEYGILRIVCSNPEKANQVLQDHGVAVALSKVFAIKLNNTVGSAAEVISLFAKEKVSIAYLYSFVYEGKGIMVFRTNNPDKANEIVDKNNLTCISEEELETLA